MALGKCRECGHEMSTTANACPQCGCTLAPKEKKVRTVTCSICKGTGYYAVSKPMSYYNKPTIPGHSCMGGVSERHNYSCNKNDEGAHKCICKDGEIEETYYSD